jgi:hypothetical protein
MAAQRKDLSLVMELVCYAVREQFKRRRHKGLFAQRGRNRFEQICFEPDKKILHERIDLVKKSPCLRNIRNRVVFGETNFALQCVLADPPLVCIGIVDQ